MVQPRVQSNRRRGCCAPTYAHTAMPIAVTSASNLASAAAVHHGSVESAIELDDRIEIVGCERARRGIPAARSSSSYSSLRKCCVATPGELTRVPAEAGRFLGRPFFPHARKSRTPGSRTSDVLQRRCGRFVAGVGAGAVCGRKLTQPYEAAGLGERARVPRGRRRCCSRERCPDSCPNLPGAR